MKALISQKVGMTNLFTDSGEMLTVTALKAANCVVNQVRTQDEDGYTAIQLGGGKVRRQSKARAGQAAGARLKVLKEVRVDDVSVEAGAELKVDEFAEGDIVDISGVSVGKGFAGTIKRYNFSSGPRSHGHDNVRQVGSIGACALPGRVLKGKKMPGRMGGKQVTVQNLKVAKVDSANNLLYVIGSVPGKKGNMVLIKSAVKK